MPPSDTERAAPPSLPAGKPASLGDVAKKITGRTTDFLAICIVLVTSLTLGAQIVSWWQTPPPPVVPSADPALAAPGWEDDLQPVDLEFGDLPLALTRQIVMGDREAAVEALARHCQAAAERAVAPDRRPDDGETRLLQRIAGLKPTAEDPGAWQVYVVDERFPLVAAVKSFPSAPAALERPGHSDKVSDHGGRRLVCYGLAMPADERSWTLFVIKGSPAGRPSPGVSADIPLPRGAARTLSLRDERGGSLVGFSGGGEPAEWIRFFDGAASTRGWPRSGDWSKGHESWAARYARTEGGWVDVRFARDRRGELTGVLQTIPKAPEPLEKGP